MANAAPGFLNNGLKRQKSRLNPYWLSGIYQSPLGEKSNWMSVSKSYSHW